MKKMMFNDKYGLTQAVLEGRKTMTRRLVPNGTTLGNWNETEKHSHYKVGEVVAIAQSYHDIGLPPTECIGGVYKRRCDEPGWTNKMFVKAELMPHRIRITDIHVERLQEISDEDCLKEGVYYHTEPSKCHEYDLYSPWSPSVKPYKFKSDKYFCSAKYAFKHLIDKVSGKGTWESNPWVFVYEFELVK